MVTKEPELEAWGLYGVQAPPGQMERGNVIGCLS